MSNYREQLQNAYTKNDPPPSVEEEKRLRGLLSQIPDLPLRLNLNVGINDGTTPFIVTIQVCFFFFCITMYYLHIFRIK